METRDLPNFPLLLEQIAHYVNEVQPVGAEQIEDRRLALEALGTIGFTLYPRVGICNGQPRSKPMK